MSSTPETISQQPKLQWFNIANVVAYAVNMIVTYGVGVSGKFPTNAELSAKYQTVVTPAGYAFSIWGIIFTAQLIWAVCQLLPSYRSSELVVKGVGYYYVAVCFAQVLWTIYFSAEQMILSLAAMISILVTLLIILIKTSRIPAQNTGMYWLFKFPFEIHAAWIMAASLVNFNVVLVALNLMANVQIILGWASLIILTVVAFYYTYKEKWVVPCVLAWASYAIKVELSNPKDSILATFSAESIATIKFAAGSVAIVVLLVNVFTCAYNRHFASPTTEGESDAYTNIDDDNVVANSSER
jgi:hypothetical protein